jgi:hypothetical protein
VTDRDDKATGAASGDRNGRLNGLPEPRRNEPRVRDSDQRMEQLENRVIRLERLIWGTNDGESELDTVDPELTRLATAAERAHELTRMLAAPEVRASCEQAIESWDQWHRRHREVLDAALSASRTIAITSADQRRRASAVEEFEAARAELASMLGSRQGYLNAATHARRQLAHDEDVRDRCQREIDAGHRAWTTLNARLRVRVAAAVDRAEPLPAWLVVALGPASSGNLEHWRELASDLLAYRITYSVSDKVEPLGADPTADDSPRRRRWHGEIHRQLASWCDIT